MNGARARLPIVAAVTAMALISTLAAASAPILDGASVGTNAVRGDAVQATETLPPSAPRRAVLISDSQMAALHWSDEKQNLGGTTWELYLDGCRRLASESCYISDRPWRLSAQEELIDIVRRQGPPPAGDIAVIATGYNDFAHRFVDDFAAVVDTALSLGFDRVAWLTYTERMGYLNADGSPVFSQRRVDLNTLLRAEVASGRWPLVTIWDFDAYSAPHREWFVRDGVHLTVAGAAAAAAWLSDQAVNN